VFIELVDVLRCPNPHAETWLVLSADGMAGRDVMSGTLGCPICRAEFRIVDGIARFGDAPRARMDGDVPDESEALRLAALLGLSDAHGYVILVGDTGRHALRLRDLTDVQLMLVNPPTGIVMGAGLSGLTMPPNGRFPLAATSARAIALGALTSAEEMANAIEVLAPGGRLLAPVGLVFPDGVTELARDDRHWLAERAAASSGIIGLTRRR
jgi:uncharacterized protein YbaR (Trm112 family)